MMYILVINGYCYLYIIILNTQQQKIIRYYVNIEMLYKTIQFFSDGIKSKIKVM